MVFNIILVLSLLGCLSGLFLRAKGWFAGGVTAEDRSIAPGKRIGGVLQASLKALFGRSCQLGKGIVLDGLLQWRLYKTDRKRWLAHSLIFWGFIPLLLLHAMDGVITVPLFSGYESTLNPWMFLRNVFGVMVVVGLGMAIKRRMQNPSRMKTSMMDIAALAVVGVIIVSGFVLEAAKIASQSDYQRMVEEYYVGDDAQELAALELVWVHDYGVAKSKDTPAWDMALYNLGQEVNESSCVYCHSLPQTAAVSYVLSRPLVPLSRSKDSTFLVDALYWLHVLVFFGALVWLPFGKLRHIVTSPLSAIADRLRSPLPNGLDGSDSPVPALRATRRMLDLDACTRCGLCTDHCSVGISAAILGNTYILPSEKLEALGEGERSKALLEGLTVCTNCLRCTGICPVGINLQDLWDAVREDMHGDEKDDAYELSPMSLHRALTFPDAFEATQHCLTEHREQAFAEAQETTVYDAGMFGGLLHTGLEGAMDGGAFRLCYNCKTCSSACPVLDHADLNELGLAPHQIIHATALGLDDLIASSRMLWACLGCYRCQERCPQGVRVADVLYLQKNKALARMKCATCGKED